MHNSTDVVVFAPTAVLAGANVYTDAVPGVLGGYLPAANYGFSDSASGAAWEITAFAMATNAEPKLIICIAELGGRVRIFSTGVGQPLTQLTGLSSRQHQHLRQKSTSLPLHTRGSCIIHPRSVIHMASYIGYPPRTRTYLCSGPAAASTFYGGLLALHRDFEALLGPSAAAKVTLPQFEQRLAVMVRRLSWFCCRHLFAAIGGVMVERMRRFLAMITMLLCNQSKAGMAQTLATFDGLSQRYGLGAIHTLRFTHVRIHSLTHSLTHTHPQPPMHTGPRALCVLSTGLDYFENSRELMTVATAVNDALLGWGVNHRCTRHQADTTRTCTCTHKS